ncbi:MAG TPA: O-methyltransferase [Terriglobales bacterium]|nr:O-methyltransferase [Terriglobales bacterium]
MATQPIDDSASWRHHDSITRGPVDSYLYALLPPRDEVLAEIEAEATRRKIPIVGPAVARFFQQLVMMTSAKNIFEMGSAVGYSTIWWARAVGEGGKVHYTDSDPKNAEQARRYFQRAGVAERIKVHIGDAIELLAEQKAEFDIVFNDIDKEEYPRVLRLVPPRLKKGGLFVTDNVLWSGRVAQPNPTEASTKAILEFNRQLYKSPDFYTTILPIRDGVAVAVRK